MPFVASMLRYGLVPRQCASRRLVLVRPGWEKPRLACRDFALAAEEQLRVARGR